MKYTLALLALGTAVTLGSVQARAEDGPPPPPPHGDHGPGQFFHDADANNDGYLTREELESAQAKRLDKMFAKTDEDKDGKLSKDELKKGHERMREKMRKRFGDRKPPAPPAEAKPE